MMEDQILNILRKVFNQEDITLNSTRESIIQWDSFGHINLIMELEKEFSISFTIEDTLGMQELSDIVDLVAANK